eukprot:6186911-Pleurochrysis_carterae.AAC.2
MCRQSPCESRRLDGPRMRCRQYQQKGLRHLQVVEGINSKIKENKNRLAPQIKSLRTLRTKFQVAPR